MEADWANLPSVVLYDLFGYLQFQDRLAASASCRKWREAFFFYPNWRKLETSTAHCDTEKNVFFFSRCSRFCRSLSVTYVIENFDEVTDLVKLWKSSRLTDIHLLGTGAPYGTFTPLFARHILPFLERMIKVSSMFLYHISNTTSIDRIILKNKETLLSLGIGAGLADQVPPLMSTNFQSEILMILLLDGMWVTEETLIWMANNLPALKIFVLSLRQENTVGNITPAGWINFNQQLPACQVRVNYHRLEDTEATSVDPCSSILSKASNITHLRMIYCSRNFQEKCVNALMRERHLLHSLTSIWSVNDPSTRDLFVRHPFVVCAWRFKHLKEMVLSGSLFDDYDLVGMVRMRPSLSILISRDDIAVQEGSSFRSISNDELTKLKQELSHGGRQEDWSPMDCERFNKASLPPLDREALVLRELIKTDLESVK